MVHVTADEAPFQLLVPGLDHLPTVRLRDFWIDRTEVSNREFKIYEWLTYITIAIFVVIFLIQWWLS